MVELRKITEDNFNECISLVVADEQSQYIASNEGSLKEAENNTNVARPFAIYINSKMVGFTMFAFDEEYEEYKELPNNYGKGFLGALIGAAVGVGSYIIIFFLGFVSSISSFISVLLGSFLYKKFGGKPNFMMIVMTTVLTIASLLLTVYLIYCLAALGYCYELELVDVTNMSIFEAFKYAMEEVEFSKEFTSNMVMTLLFTLLGAGYETYSLYKGMYKKQQIK